MEAFHKVSEISGIITTVFLCGWVLFCFYVKFIGEKEILVLATCRYCKKRYADFVMVTRCFRWMDKVHKSEEGICFFCLQKALDGLLHIKKCEHEDD